ncbi:MAG: NapC/NirT family cytochrome c [bacterium]|nr:NapC/NirT family cytochrome c [bacterium]
MTDKERNHYSESTSLPQTLIRSFWAVFMLPFRMVRFAFRRLSEIPLKNLLLMGLIFVVLVLITLTVLIKATSQPGFCVTCHYMEPYFASWKVSSHKDVHCTVCHFPPGIKGTVAGKFTAIAMVANYVTGVYKKSKPWAEISDKSCLREGCHSNRLLEGKVRYKEGIIFDHTPHLTRDRRGKNLRCTSCHSQIVQGNHMTVTEETCFLCHFKDQPQTARQTQCTLCHKAPVPTDSATVVFDHTDIVQKQVNCRLCHGDMAVGNGDVPKEKCSYCHAEAGKLQMYSETVQLHQIHISDHKVECNHCHNAILHRSIARTGEIKPDCQACHLDRHIAQYDLFSGQGAEGVDPMPSAMFHAGLGCKTCHVLLPEDWRKHPGIETTTAGPASCDPCHDRSFFKLYQQARPVLNEQTLSTQQRLSAIKQSHRFSSSDSVIAAATTNLEMIVRGHPIHNLAYSDRILKSINRSLDLREGKKPVPLPLPDTTAARCLRCHFGQDEIAVPYGNHLFSHRNHVHGQNLSCKTCHIEEKPNHGKLKSDVNCNGCHHRAAAVSCDPCHSTQKNFRRAEGVFTGFESDVMYQAELTCRDCHDVSGAQVNRPTEKNCVPCHEPTYWEDMHGRQTAFRQNLTDLDIEIGKLPPSPTAEKARILIQALKADGSGGAHNLTSAPAALDSIRILINGAK